MPVVPPVFVRFVEINVEVMSPRQLRAIVACRGRTERV